MRVTGSGTGGSGFGQGGSRSDSFRKRHRVGQQVRGVLLKNLPDSMAWVEIDGDRLLAQLEVAHPEGSRLLFVIKQLTPEIVLKELRASLSAGVGALDLVKAFDSARTLFEQRFRVRLNETGKDGRPLPLDEFLELLANDHELRAGYLDAANCARAVTAVLRGDGRGTLLYQPWLAPDAMRQATYVAPGHKSSPLTEILVEFDHPRLGLVRTQFLHLDGALSCRLKMQHPSRDKGLLRYLNSRNHDGPPINHLGTVKLPRTSHGGLVAELLFRA